MIGTFHMIEGAPLWLTLMTFFLFSMGMARSAQDTKQKTYAFKVFLDGDEIGFQRFVVSAKGTRTQISVEAEFDVKYFFITFYTYRHNNVEVWEGECLKEIRAKTNDNGESFFVEGTSKGGKLRLHTHDGEQTLEGCIKTFAYWNPAWFQSSRLLNSQTGELQPVEIQIDGIFGAALFYPGKVKNRTGVKAGVQAFRFGQQAGIHGVGCLVIVKSLGGLCVFVLNIYGVAFKIGGASILKYRFIAAKGAVVVFGVE